MIIDGSSDCREECWYLESYSGRLRLFIGSLEAGTGFSSAFRGIDYRPPRKNNDNLAVEHHHNAAAIATRSTNLCLSTPATSWDSSRFKPSVFVY